MTSHGLRKPLGFASRGALLALVSSRACIGPRSSLCLVWSLALDAACSSSLMPAQAQSNTRERRPSAASRSTKWFKSFISRSSNKSSEHGSSENHTNINLGDCNMDDGIEILTPSASDVVYKYTWNIKKFGYCCRKRTNPVFDSEAFEMNINGLRTRWNLSIRFWTGPDGKRVMSPVVACLNLLRCWPEEQPGTQATVKFQFGVYSRQSGRFEMAALSRSVLTLGATRHIVSVGHQDVEIVQRHLESQGGDIKLVCKLQVVPTGSEDERHSLSQDMGALLIEDTEVSTSPWARGDVKLRAVGGQTFPAHCCILGARSPRLAALLDNTELPKSEMPVLDLDDLTPDVLQEILRYIYTGRVENLDSLASSLLGAACKYELPGLTILCERALLETINAESVASRLLLADEYGCETLKRGALAFCEGHAGRMPKNVAWTVMEMVNPELFQEACEAGIGDSASSFGSSLSDAGSSSR